MSDLKACPNPACGATSGRVVKHGHAAQPLIECTCGFTATRSMWQALPRRNPELARELREWAKTVSGRIVPFVRRAATALDPKSEPERDLVDELLEQVERHGGDPTGLHARAGKEIERLRANEEDPVPDPEEIAACPDAIELGYCPKCWAEIIDEKPNRLDEPRLEREA